jgi:hypothetical protein
MMRFVIMKHSLASPSFSLHNSEYSALAKTEGKGKVVPVLN